MATLEIRRFKKRDREAILRITAAGFENVSMDHNLEQMFGSLGDTNWQDRKVRGVNAELDSFTEHVFVCESEGSLVGYITTDLNASTKIGHIRNLAVDPARQGRGAGRQLIETALQYFCDMGMETAKIETMEQNEICRKFYPTFGFKEYARQIYYAMKL
ncbi:GNAT family N-acetyltransferase [Planctomycetota bacterium]